MPNAGDPYGTRTHDTTVRGWCLNRLTNGPYEILVTRAGAFANAQRKSKIFRTLLRVLVPEMHSKKAPTRGAFRWWTIRDSNPGPTD